MGEQKMKFNDLSILVKEEILMKVSPYMCIDLLRNGKDFEIMYYPGKGMGVKAFRIGKDELLDILEEHIKRMEPR